MIVPVVGCLLCQWYRLLVVTVVYYTSYNLCLLCYIIIVYSPSTSDSISLIGVSVQSTSIDTSASPLLTFCAVKYTFSPGCTITAEPLLDAGESDIFPPAPAVEPTTLGDHSFPPLTEAPNSPLAQGSPLAIRRLFGSILVPAVSFVTSSIFCTYHLPVVENRVSMKAKQLASAGISNKIPTLAPSVASLKRLPIEYSRPLSASSFERALLCCSRADCTFSLRSMSVVSGYVIVLYDSS